MKEIWKDVVDYEGYYQVSNLGGFRSLERKSRSGKMLKAKVLTGTIAHTGYISVHLSKNGVLKKDLLHRLVMKAFVENPHNYPQVNHIDENKTNNRITNLEWVSPKQNANHGTRNQRMVESAILNNKLGKPVTNGFETFQSIRGAARITGISSSGIMACLRGSQKTAGGFTWRYMNE